jgi:hypothetical protein
MSPSKRVPPVGFRLPPDLKEWLADQAVRNRRSQNAELVHRLEQSRRQEQQEARQA